MTRDEVYELINGERSYQDAMTMSESRPDMVELSMGDYILAMEHCLLEARKQWYSGSRPHQNAAEYIRKVAGLSVSAMEKFGAPPRKF